jgi:hypothetical protein
MATIKYTSAEKIKEAITNDYKLLEDVVNNMVSKTDFRVGTSSVDSDQASITLVIYTDPEKEETARCSTLKLSLEEDIFDTGKGKRFVTNISTTGDFDLEDTSRGSRANFYIQVGKVLGDSELLSDIKTVLIVHAAVIRGLRKKWRELNTKDA